MVPSTEPAPALVDFLLAMIIVPLYMEMTAHGDRGNPCHMSTWALA
jgi:hypothetical protein